LPEAHFFHFFTFFMDPFLGEIRLMAITFAPNGWALCQGQLMSISQNTALFSLLGTMYGGDGRVTFGLPDLRGRTPVGMGQGPGLAQYTQGQQAGVEGVTLLTAEIPAHVHAFAPAMPVNTGVGTSSSPEGAYYAQAPKTATEQYGGSVSATSMASDILSGTTSNIGGNLPHENRMPLLTMTYAIALQGIYPPRP
jgi:microcystin-dependent protein